MEAALEEVAHVWLVNALRLRHVLGDADLLGEGALVGVELLAGLFHAAPEALHQLLGAEVAGEREVAVVVAVLGAEIPGLD